MSCKQPRVKESMTFAAQNHVVEYWMKDLLLYPSDKDYITSGKWLTDNIITAGQKLLKMAHPNMEGLQPPILGDTLAFEIQRGRFVQF